MIIRPDNENFCSPGYLGLLRWNSEKTFRLIIQFSRRSIWTTTALFSCGNVFPVIPPDESLIAHWNSTMHPPRESHTANPHLKGSFGVFGKASRVVIVELLPMNGLGADLPRRVSSFGNRRREANRAHFSAPTLEQIHSNIMLKTASKSHRKT
jgi:hypothetical protein